MIVMKAFLHLYYMVMQEGRAAGCRTSAEADRYLEQKRRRVAEENAQRAKESGQGVPNAFMPSDSTVRPAGPAASSSVNEMDVTGCNGADLLSENVKASSLSPFCMSICC